MNHHLNTLRRIKSTLLSIKRGLFLVIARGVNSSHNGRKWNTFLTKIWRSAGLCVDQYVFIDRGFKCYNIRNITLGNYVSLGHDNHIWAFNTVKIGNFTQTAKDLLIIAGSHDIETLSPKDNQQVDIGAGCWIGARVTIIGGVKIGKGVIIGACSLINKDVPDFAVVVGNPARIIRYRSITAEQWNPFKTYQLDELS